MTLPESSPPDQPAAQNVRNLWISVVAGVVIVAAVLVIVALAHSGDHAGAPAATGTSTTLVTSTRSAVLPATSPPAPGAGLGGATGTSAAGCAPAGDGVPKGAGAHKVVDVDGDGKPDTAWITPGSKRRVGITTASGATFSAAIDSASPERASAIVQQVEPDGVPIVLVDTGREVLLYSAAGCHLTPTQNSTGTQYAFDKGFTGHGTGVECVASGDRLQLAGVLAKKNDGTSTYTVSRTFVLLDPDASHAANSSTDLVAKKAAEHSSIVETARETTCGNLIAGKDGPVEPAS